MKKNEKDQQQQTIIMKEKKIDKSCGYLRGVCIWDSDFEGKDIRIHRADRRWIGCNGTSKYATMKEFFMQIHMRVCVWKETTKTQNIIRNATREFIAYILIRFIPFFSFISCVVLVVIVVPATHGQRMISRRVESVRVCVRVHAIQFFTTSCCSAHLFSFFCCLFSHSIKPIAFGRLLYSPLSLSLHSVSIHCLVCLS